MQHIRIIHQTFHVLLSAAMCVAASVALAEQAGDEIGELDCVINPSVVADLGSSAPGILSKVHVDRSDFVQSGDVIAELESGVETASVDLAKTRADSTAEVDLRRVNAGYGNRLRDRTKDLFKRKVVSNNDLDERETEARLGWIQLRQAQDNKSIANLELVRAEEILKRRTINSPITGVVMERFKVVGEYVEDQPVARVAQLDPLHVEVIVPVDHLGKVSPGMTAEVWTDVVDGQRWQAEVMRVDRVADVASGTYGVRLSLPNPDYKIPAGLRCRMALVETTQQVAADSPPTEMKGESVASLDAVLAELSAATQAMPAPATASEVAQATPPPAQPSNQATPEPPLAVQQAVEPNNTLDVISTVAGTPKQAPDPSHADAQTDKATTRKANAREPVAKAEPAVSDPPQASTATAVTGQATAQSQPVETPPVERPVAETAEDRRVCRVAGPFQNEIDATRHVVKLRRAGLDVEMKAADKQTDVEYKVMTPLLADQAAADEVLKSLAAAGLDDVFVVSKPGGKRRVYLGLYNGERGAAKRVLTLKKAGIKAFFQPSKSVGSDYFVVARGLPGRDTDRLFAALPASQSGAAAELGFCEQSQAVSMR